MTDECTVVTAYYKLETSKHSVNNYDTWIKNYLENIQAKMVIFTDEKSVDKIKEHRKKFLDKTVFVTCPMSDFYCYKYMEHWLKDHQRDPENSYHNINLYMVWNEKTMFIKKAMDMNPFNTDFYCWTDIGMVRDLDDMKHISTFPNPCVLKHLKKDKIYLLNIESNNTKHRVLTEMHKYKDTISIGAGVMMGHKNIMPVWIDEYYKMLNHLIENDSFAGKEQYVMACVVMMKPELFEIVKPVKTPFDEWFYLLYYFGNIHIPLNF